MVLDLSSSPIIYQSIAFLSDYILIAVLQQCLLRLRNKVLGMMLTFRIEVERAVENLVKSGKMFGGVSSRRESMPVIGGPRAFPEYGMRDKLFQATGLCR